jgi:predicted RNase H-like nuclease (RuvC/YqgF family)
MERFQNTGTLYGGNKNNKKKEVKAVKEDIKPYYADNNTKRLLKKNRELSDELDKLKISFKELEKYNNELVRINHTLKIRIKSSQFKDN